MKKLLLAAACACFVSACGKPPVAPEPQATPPLGSGIETQYFDDKVSAREDFYRHVNGKWLDSTDIPADENTWDVNEELQVRVQQQLKALIEDLRAKPDAGDPDQRKIAALYASFMDEAALERLGLKPLQGELARIDAIDSRGDIAAEMGHLALIGVHTPLVPDLAVDTGNAMAYAAYLYPGGFGLPDRDYYIEADARLAHIRQAYAGYVQTLLTLSGDKAAVPDAAAVLKLETSLARVLWTQAQYRDPVKTYNKVPVAKLGNLAPDFDWSGYLGAAGLAGKTDAVVVIQPDYVQAFNQALRRTPLPVWRAYFRTRLLSNYAPYLDRRFADADFAFKGTVLTGTPTRQPRWQRGVELVDQSIGEGLGRQYVARYFPPASKARIEDLVHNIVAAYAHEFDTLAWMGPETRRKAREKLLKLRIKVGYPERWRDYGALAIVGDDLVGNVMRARGFDYQRRIDRLGQPVDRDEWGNEDSPQNVDGSYYAEQNQIVLSAALLQPPYFNAQADDAANYGAIGGFIGHEISHGFDNEGSQFDADGNLLGQPGWFTPEDQARFNARASGLARQYDAFEPMPGVHMNGELTLSENLADNAGMAIAYKAWRASLNGRPAATLDGLDGDQRFFIAWAQMWRGKMRDNQEMLWLKTEGHPLDAIRGFAPLQNMDAFYEAFGIQPGDRMYLPPERRITVW